MTTEGELAADRRVFGPSKQISRRVGLGGGFTYISRVMWLWSNERFLKVRQRTVFSVISLKNVGR